MKVNSYRTELALFLFLTAIFMVFYTGSYYTIDEMAIFSMSDSMLKEGRLSIDQLNWVQANKNVSIGEYGVDGRLYAKGAPTQALLSTPILWFTRQLGQWGAVQSIYLVNVWLTALNGVVLFRLGKRWGHGKRASLVTALLFGVGTMALPYSKTLFTEPLSSLCLLGAFYLITHFNDRVWRVALAGILLGIAGSTRLSNFILVPLFGLYFVAVTRPGFLTLHKQSAKSALRWLFKQLWQLRLYVIAFVTPVIIAIVLYLSYNSSRFVAVTETGYAEYEGFRSSIWNGLYILLFSPGRSIFLYVPLLILVLLLMRRFWQAHPAGAIFLSSLTILHILTIASWFGVSGGWAWGPRLLMPLMSLWCVPLFILPEWWATSAKHKLSAIILSGLSISSQLLGTAVDYAESLQNLADQRLVQGERNVYEFALSGHPQHLNMIEQGKLDLAWLLRERLAPVSDVHWQVILPLLLAVGLTSYILRLTLRRQNRTWPYLILGVLSLGVVTNHTLKQYSSLRLVYHRDVTSAVNLLSLEAQPSSAILSTAVTHSQTWQNLYHGNLPLYGVRNQPLNQISELQSKRLSLFMGRYREVWLLMEWAPAGNPDNGLEQWMTKHHYPAEEYVFGGLRLIRYINAPIELPVVRNASATLGQQIQLIEYGLFANRIWAGTNLPVSLTWHTITPPDQTYTVFLQLLNESGQVVAQIDRQPVVGLQPTHTWQTDELIVDHYALPIAPDLSPGDYQLIVGMYGWPSLERLSVMDGDSAEKDYIPLHTITILPHQE